MQIALVAPDAWTIWLFYQHLVKALQREGATITAITAESPHIDRLKSLGIEHVSVPYDRFVAPSQDIALYHALRKTFNARRFDIVQNITIKANLFGALAANRAGVGNILNTVEGAGLLYSDNPSARVRAIRAAAEVGLHRAKTKATLYWFVNHRDRDVFCARGLAFRARSVVAIATGVDTRQFDPDTIGTDGISALRRELAIEADVPIVANVAGRLLTSKGIGEFIDAATKVRSAGIRAQFLLVGPEEEGNPDAFAINRVRDAVRAGVLRWIPFREDVWTIYGAASVAVVPTYYAEGTPKGVMEAMAMRRPLVACDVPSIRALVADRQDAVLVAPRSGSAIAENVISLLASASQRDSLGSAARKTAVTRFDADVVARIAIDEVYSELPAWRSRQM